MSDLDVTVGRTPLFELHQRLRGRLVAFAGWELPVRFDAGPIAEHVHTRRAASLFDVSHMGIVELSGLDFAGLAAALEALVPADIGGLAAGAQRYTMLTDDAGGTIDDVIVSRLGERIGLVVNASRRSHDLAHLRGNLAAGVEIVERDDLALLALQGPASARALGRLAPGVDALAFMEIAEQEVAGVGCRVSRSGYTGEDGFEIQVPAERAVAVAEQLLAVEGVAPAGLAARDSLRLEAGLCLYGHELDESTTLVEAGLGWTVPRARRAGVGYPGAEVLASQLDHGAPRRRVGLVVAGRQPVRDGAVLRDPSGCEVGAVTSGGYGPTVEAPIAMAYVPAELSGPGTELIAVERGRELAVSVSKLPFVPHRYHRRAAGAPGREENK